MQGIQFCAIAQRGFRGIAWRKTLPVALGLLFLTASQSDAQILHKKKRANTSTAPQNTAEPDKVLYERAVSDIAHGRGEVGRLGLQTLINTYPDSEYLAKAKLKIADSYYKEGGTANMMQAIQGYKDFIIFFPFLPEASYAQYQVANAHYQQMAKPDRDRSEARAAEDEFQTFLEKYPKDPLVPKAEQRLRDVQEVIAEGDYRIGYFYYTKGDKRAAAARLASVTQRYPLYSKSDHALWMLGDIYSTTEHKEIASLYYSQIIRNYPLSSYASGAKNRLVASKVPVPQPDPNAVAWMQAEQKAPRQKQSFVKKPLSLVHSGPQQELVTSAKSGKPNLEPEADTTSATDILSGGFHPQVGSGGSSLAVQTVTPGGSVPANSAASTDAKPDAAKADATATSTDTTATADATKDVAKSAASDPAAAKDAAAKDPAPAKDAAAQSSSADPNAKTDPSKADVAQNATQGDPKKESSSKKKKKGIKKIIPWV